MKSSGTTNSPGLMFFFREPVEDEARMCETPSLFSAWMFALWLIRLAGG
jgi:hypothetical protein